jgi:predicted DNA-binding transcriptional regulator AlpA
MSNIDTDTLPPEIAENRLLSTKQTATLYGVSPQHLRWMNKQGKLPKPIKLGPSTFGWRAKTVLDDIKAREAASQSAA